MASAEKMSSEDRLLLGADLMNTSSTGERQHQNF
jgi:hypothetical protein